GVGVMAGLSALEPEADAERLWDAASLEEEWQAEQWGRDEEAEERRERRTADFLRACEFAKLARG
ncbi:MAG: molecular chaperone, partial [Erythrobacter sp.]|nr:molecular chaperone [Erythrobacter sp.]